MGCRVVARELWELDSLVGFFWAFLSAWVLGSALARGIVMREREIVGLRAVRLWRASCGS